MHYLTYGDVPFDGSAKQARSKKLRLSDVGSQPLMELITWCLQKKPMHRPTMTVSPPKRGYGTLVHLLKWLTFLIQKNGITDKIFRGAIPT